MQVVFDFYMLETAFRGLWRSNELRLFRKRFGSLVLRVRIRVSYVTVI